MGSLGTSLDRGECRRRITGTLTITTMTQVQLKGRPGRKPKVDPREVVQWRLENSASSRATAEHFGISQKTVLQMWRKAGLSYAFIEQQGAQQSIDSKAVAEWRREREASITETARHFGIAESSVWRACQAHGVDLSHRWGPGRLLPRRVSVIEGES